MTTLVNFVAASLTGLLLLGALTVLLATVLLAGTRAGKSHLNRSGRNAG